MTADLDTLLTALYVLIDDHVIEPGQRRPGHPKKLSDAELVCLAVAQVLLGARSGASLAADVPRAARAPVPLPAPAARLPQTPQGRRAADLQDHALPAALCPSWADGLRLLDATPVPCGTSRETVRRSELAGWANYGYCAAHSRWYWGLKLYLLTTAEGMPVTWCLADPKLG